MTEVCEFTNPNMSKDEVIKHLDETFNEVFNYLSEVIKKLDDNDPLLNEKLKIISNLANVLRIVAQMVAEPLPHIQDKRELLLFGKQLATTGRAWCIQDEILIDQMLRDDK